MAKNSECQPERGKLWRAALFLMVVFCVLASVAQINDPDPFLWMVIYGVPGIVTFFALLCPTFIDARWWCLTVGGVLGALLAFAVTFMASAAQKGELHFDLVTTEKGRESGGLLILLTWLSILLFSSCGKGKSVVVAVGVLVFAVVPLVAWVAYELYWKMHCQVPPHCTGTF